VSRLVLKDEIVSPLAGTIQQICFRTGDRVQEGTAIFTLVSEQGERVEVISRVSGTVGEMEVEQGEAVIAGMILTVVYMDDIS
jgi:biotin carboxyl carrier protein